MFTRLPDLVDPQFYAEQKRQIKAKVAQAQLPRLVQAIASPHGDVFVEMRFFKQKQTGAPAFELQLNTELTLTCQRTLGTYTQSFESAIRGVFLPAMQLAEELDADWEVYNLPEDKISLIPIIEDEVLLAIPMVPRVEGEVLTWSESAEPAELSPDEDKANPFLALAKLKSKPE